MIKIFLIAFIFLLNVNFVFADVSQFVFTSSPQTIKPNEVSDTITVQAQDSSGLSFKIPQTGCLHLETTSSSGQFSSSNATWTPVTILTMSKNTANRNFYYKDSAVGNFILTVKAALTNCSSWTGEQWTATQNIIVSENGTTTSATQEATATQESVTTSSSSNSSSSSIGGGSAWPEEPQIFANAGEDKTAIAGADVYFSGEALGLEKKPLDNARFLWNFGDGASEEGESVSHIYNYPGDYILVLDVSSGKYSASDRALVKILPNQVIISEASKDFIKLFNGANVVLDISGWFLKAGEKTFKLPASTLIKANSSLIIPSANSGLLANDRAELLYPNNTLVYSFVKHSMSNIVSTTTPKSVPEIISASSVPSETKEAAAANVITLEKKSFWTAGKTAGLIVLAGFLGGLGFLLMKKKEA